MDTNERNLTRPGEKERMTMRQYRGKRIDNEEMIEGYFFKSWEQAYILWGTTNGVPNMVEVHPDTVGQSTSWKDGGDEEIFRGDKIKGEVFHQGVYIEFEGVVDWEEMELTWCVYNPASGRTKRLTDIAELEIIGNIHTKDKVK